MGKWIDAKTYIDDSGKRLTGTAADQAARKEEQPNRFVAIPADIKFTKTGRK